MSIALKRIKERKFIKPAAETGQNAPAELVIMPPTKRIENNEPEPEKRAPETAFTGSFESESAQPSRGAENAVKSEIQAKYGRDAQTPKNLDSQTLKFWGNVFNGEPELKEGRLIDLLLELDNLEGTPANNTKELNRIFKDENKGYLKQTSPYSHVWELACKK